MNSAGDTGLWDDVEGLYFDQLAVDGKHIPLKVRSIVSLLPLIAVEVFDDEIIELLPSFY